MPTRDASAGSYHGTTTPSTAEVVALGAAEDFENYVEVTKWDADGDLFFALAPAGDDIDITATGQPGLSRIADGVIGGRRLSITRSSAQNVVLKSSDAVRYTVERVGPGDGELTGAGGAGGGVASEVELGATSLAALESITVVDGGATVSVDDGAGSLTVDGAVAATQSGTWTVQPGNTANTTAWKVDGSAATQPVSAASLPLPTGAATAAKQPALGTAGAASTDVVTIQGIASGTVIPVSDGGGTVTVDDGGASLTVDGTVTADTELPAAAALSDTASNPTTPTVGGATLYWDGTQWVRWQRNVKELTVSSATLANVAASASNVAVFASNAAARGRAVQNESASATLYLKYGATASATSYTVAVGPGQHYEFPAPLYTGACDGIWTAAVGTARTTETS